MHKLSQDNLTYAQCYSCERKASGIAVASNLLLAVFKLVVGIISGSKAVIGDSLYSFKDFMTSLVVLIGVKISGKPADDDHHYGHGKIEFVAIFLISLLIIIGTLFLFIHSVKDVWGAFHGTVQPPKFIAFWAAVVSVIANYKLSSYLHCVGQRRGSPAMLANAKHNHSDAVSSAFVAVAIVLTRFGFYSADPLVAVIETLDLIRLSSSMLNDSLKGIMDSSINPAVIRQMNHFAGLVPGVKRVASINARKVGQGIWVEIVIKVDHSKTLDNGYLIGRHVEETLMKRVDNIVGINLAVEPYIP
ncbi:magnetosome biogenesis CDF transporter MamM [Candidatus Magnetominusculus xianensis]|uniref:Magnetosome protein MamM n=1 Tax=Candidatus Magnetominusculus xianensis TaxID=1748249 RepID=A0ABR5SJL1_9BACT|nr:magnetosome biogenesis CDF transporter MamM [Candidatus Magnetominusculus xianensis]KWT94831.1 magnetosome protein MamM [Candidatus Magnetominusculus xianensis]MBF0404723.1 magnetosome biogenesis CDF transporter MamM [Nitrospirota bacterium]